MNLREFEEKTIFGDHKYSVIITSGDVMNTYYPEYIDPEKLSDNWKTATYLGYVQEGEIMFIMEDFVYVHDHGGKTKIGYGSGARVI